MKKLHLSVIAAILVFLLISVSTAEENNVNAMTAVVPADSIAQFIKPLLPYRIDFGENFTGEIWIKSIENIKIKKNRIFFSTHIYGKNIKYVTYEFNKKILTINMGISDVYTKKISYLLI
jgi:hypothetical protein